MSEKRVLEIIDNYFKEVQKKNPSFSLRALAKKLDISAPYLTLILNGKRRLSKKNAEKILEALGVKKYQRLELIADLETSKKRKADLAIETEIGQSRFKKVELRESDTPDEIVWRTRLRSLSATPDFRDDPDWIYERIGLSTDEYIRVRDKMLSIGDFKYNSLGKLVVKDNEIDLKPGNMEQRSFFAKILDMEFQSFREAIKHIVDSGFKRPGTGYSLVADIDPNSFQEFREMMQLWISEFATRNEKIKLKKTEVYTLSIGLFPNSFGVTESDGKYEREDPEIDKKLASAFIDRKKYDQFIEKCKELGIEGEGEIQEAIEKKIGEVMKRKKD